MNERICRLQCGEYDRRQSHDHEQIRALGVVYKQERYPRERDRCQTQQEQWDMFCHAVYNPADILKVSAVA